MDFKSTRFPLTIVSTDTTALREVAWTLSAYGYQATAYSDWSEQAPWRRLVAPSLVILDARDKQEIEAEFASPRSTPYAYRVALYDASLLANPDVLMDLGADDLVRYPVNAGELMSSLRRGARRLEFERRFTLSNTYDQQTGVANRRGFTRQLDRKLRDNSDAPNNALVVLGIDFLETLREQHGCVAVAEACAHAVDVLRSESSAHDSRGILDEGIFAVLLEGRSVSEGVAFAEGVNERIGASNKKGPRISLSGVVFGWPANDTAEATIERALAGMEHVRGWGGKQVLDEYEVERGYSVWSKGFAGHQTNHAKHVMEALPLVLPLDSATPAGALGISSFASTALPPCVPVVDHVGHLVGVVDGETFQSHGKEVFNTIDEHLRPVPTTLRGDSRLDEIAASFESAERDYLLVVENEKPIGYVTHETLSALSTEAADGSSDHHFASVDSGLSSLVVPLN